ncbi:MAG: hypothetical protein FVQ82_13935 [Planctomycetes bacterium]|nr:hypothetical protein [Planctomycetota bacterium]
MKKCNVIIFDDNKLHGTNLAESLQEEYEYEVILFRDLDTFQAVFNDNSLKFSNSKLPDIIIMDIMMSEELDENEPYSKRLPITIDYTDILARKYCNDNLGLIIARDIRGGIYKPVPNDIPILFFTARQAEHVINEIKSCAMQPAAYLRKASWLDEIQEKIQELMNISNKKE